MPYIKQDQREKIDDTIDELIQEISHLEVDFKKGPDAEDYVDLRNLDGVLNYTITRLLNGTLRLVDEPKYTKFNTGLGILEGVKLELYRRRIGPYENEKIEENGDVE